MGDIGLIAFAFPVGLTLCGLAGAVMELLGGRRLAFAEPFVSPGHLLRSLAAAALAGPAMLVNDALAARRARRISLLLLVSCMATAVLWTFALGTVAMKCLTWTMAAAAA